jgi:uncharacterized membrane protein
MIDFSISIRILKPADMVYKAFIDPDNMIKWHTDLTGYESVKGKYPELGSVSRLYYKSGKNSYFLEERLEQIETGKRIVSVISGSALEARIEVTFIPDDWETELQMSWSGKGKGVVSLLTMRFSEKKVKLQTENDLAKFKDLVESFGVKFR